MNITWDKELNLFFSECIVHYPPTLVEKFMISPMISSITYHTLYFNIYLYLFWTLLCLFGMPTFMPIMHNFDTYCKNSIIPITASNLSRSSLL